MVYQIYCMALFHSQTQHMINLIICCLNLFLAYCRSFVGCCMYHLPQRLGWRGCEKNLWPGCHSLQHGRLSDPLGLYSCYRSYLWCCDSCHPCICSCCPSGQRTAIRRKIQERYIVSIQASGYEPVNWKLIFLSINQNIYCRYSKNRLNERVLFSTQNKC